MKTQGKRGVYKPRREASEDTSSALILKLRLQNS